MSENFTDLRERLEQNVMVVDFIKVNGDKRVMTCTLREDIRPAKVLTEVTDGVQRKIPTESISVWDVNAKGWRSFRYDSIVDTSIVEEYEQDWYNKG